MNNFQSEKNMQMLFQIYSFGWKRIPFSWLPWVLFLSIPGTMYVLPGTIDPDKSWQKTYCYGYAPYTTKDYTSVPNMAAAASEANVSRYPSEKSVKEALDMLKPPGILSKVSLSTNMSSKNICLRELVQRKRTNVLQYSIKSNCEWCRALTNNLWMVILQAYNQFQLKRYQVSYFCCLLVYL